MEQKDLKIRAVILDVYGTLLEVGAPPRDADAQWQKMFEELLGTPPPLDRAEFSRRSSRIIARMHADAKTRGVLWPEILWPSVVLEVIPNLSCLSQRKFDDFILRQMQLGRSLRLIDHSADFLRQMRKAELVLGIASNSQAYTLRELDSALNGARLDLSIFDPHLRFWSFENGFSKPNPHVFRILTARLEARGIRPSQALMIGDRLDNDVQPALAHGWQAWQLAPKGKAAARIGGDYRELSKAMA
jgi:FMN phosphatase YigB (HAD superfamily)